jgi:hypothetical protein
MYWLGDNFRYLTRDTTALLPKEASRQHARERRAAATAGHITTRPVNMEVGTVILLSRLLSTFATNARALKH